MQSVFFLKNYQLAKFVEFARKAKNFFFLILEKLIIYSYEKKDLMDDATPTRVREECAP